MNIINEIESLGFRRVCAPPPSTHIYFTVKDLSSIDNSRKPTQIRIPNVDYNERGLYGKFIDVLDQYGELLTSTFIYNLKEILN